MQMMFNFLGIQLAGHGIKLSYIIDGQDKNQNH